MKKIILIFLIFTTLIISINVISASNDTQTTSNNIPTTTNTTTPIKTSVSTPDTGFVYKKNNYMKITIKDKTSKNPIKSLKIKVKVYTNKKSKTYTLKTNANGIAKLSTKKFKLGSHKFIINTTNSKYTVIKKGSLFIGKKHSITLKINKHKKLKSGDAISTFIQKSNGQYKKGVYTDVWYAGVNSDIEPHHTMIIKAKLFFKNKKTGKIITKTTKGKLFTYNGEVYRSMPSTDLIKGYTPYKTTIWYLSSK